MVCRALGRRASAFTAYYRRFGGSNHWLDRADAKILFRRAAHLALCRADCRRRLGGGLVLDLGQWRFSFSSALRKTRRKRRGGSHGLANLLTYGVSAMLTQMADTERSPVLGFALPVVTLFFWHRGRLVDGEHRVRAFGSHYAHASRLFGDTTGPFGCRVAVRFEGA